MGIKQATRSRRGKSGTYGASVFGGPNDPGTGHIGYRGDNLNEKWDSFAELSKNPGALDFSAMGGLKYGQRVRVTAPNGRSLVLRKRDVGAGGGKLGGHTRGIDIWWKAAEKLRINGGGAVKVEILDGRSKGKTFNTIVGSVNGQQQSQTGAAQAPPAPPVSMPSLAPAIDARQHLNVQAPASTATLSVAPLPPPAPIEPVAAIAPIPGARPRQRLAANPRLRGAAVRAGGGYNGTAEMATRFKQIGRKYGGVVSSEKRSRQNTSSGNVSDHFEGNKNAYAIDVAQGDLPAIANAYARKLGIKDYKPGSIVNKIVKDSRGRRVRVQLIYGTSDHRDHVHVGFKVL